MYHNPHASVVEERLPLSLDLRVVAGETLALSYYDGWTDMTVLRLLEAEPVVGLELVGATMARL
jgi:hypothetical protein